MSTLTESTETTGAEDDHSPSDELRDNELDVLRETGGIRSMLPILVGSVAVGIAAVAVIGVQLTRRRQSKTLLRRAASRAEDVRDALTHAAAELPERGKAAVRRVRRCPVGLRPQADSAPVPLH